MYLTQSKDSRDCVPYGIVNLVKWAGGNWNQNDIAWIKDAVLTEEDGTSLFDAVHFLAGVVPQAELTFSTDYREALTDLEKGKALLLGFSYFHDDDIMSHISLFFMKNGEIQGANVVSGAPLTTLSRVQFRNLFNHTVVLQDEVVYVSVDP